LAAASDAPRGDLDKRYGPRKLRYTTRDCVTGLFLTGRVEGWTVWDCLLRSSAGLPRGNRGAGPGRGVRFPGRGRNRLASPRSRPGRDLGQIVSAPLGPPPDAGLPTPAGTGESPARAPPAVLGPRGGDS